MTLSWPISDKVSYKRFIYERTHVTISRNKLTNLKACARPSGVIAALAMDQRVSLFKALAAASSGTFSDAQFAEFKTVVSKVLTPYTSAILLDPEYGLEAGRERASGTGLIFAYEQSGYDNSKPGRLPDLEPRWSVRRLAEAGATGVKLLIYYNPCDAVAVNEVKQALVERVGAECEAAGLVHFLEPLVYDDALPGAEDFAAKKPAYVAETVHEFSQDRYAVDILKIEMPVSGTYVSGLSSAPKAAIFSREEAVEHLREVGDLAKRPFIYLSGGVDMRVFAEMLTLAGENDVPYSGVLCGRATWKGGIPVFAHAGSEALAQHLAGDGVGNIKMLNEVLERYAKPWHHLYGGVGALEATA